MRFYNLKLLEAHLLSEGYRILKASCGVEALKMAQERPGLILLDIMMPDMDGLEPVLESFRDTSIEGKAG
jgi:CheY-like chemotaxis protein